MCCSLCNLSNCDEVIFAMIRPYSIQTLEVPRKLYPILGVLPLPSFLIRTSHYWTFTSSYEITEKRTIVMREVWISYYYQWAWDINIWHIMKQILTYDVRQNRVYGSSATILTSALPWSILLPHIYKTPYCLHHRSIFVLYWQLTLSIIQNTLSFIRYAI